MTEKKGCFRKNQKPKRSAPAVSVSSGIPLHRRGRLDLDGRPGDAEVRRRTVIGTVRADQHTQRREGHFERWTV